MKKAIWIQSYKVNSLLVNPQKKLGLFGLLNLFQDASWVHATHLGHGYESMIENQTAWVLTRQKLIMNQWPHWEDEIEIKTWIRPLAGIVAVRDFEITLEGKVIGQCTTQWLIMDLKSRKPSDKNLKMSSDEFCQELPFTWEASKILIKKETNAILSFDVRNSDLDMNGHVNNTRYAQWILDSIPLDKHHQYRLCEYEVNFIAETKFGDTVTINSVALSDELIHFQGVRIHDNKIVFTATLKVSAEQSSPMN